MLMAVALTGVQLRDLATAYLGKQNSSGRSQFVSRITPRLSCLRVIEGSLFRFGRFFPRSSPLALSGPAKCVNIGKILRTAGGQLRGDKIVS